VPSIYITRIIIKIAKGNKERTFRSKRSDTAQKGFDLLYGIAYNTAFEQGPDLKEKKRAGRFSTVD